MRRSHIRNTLAAIIAALAFLLPMVAGTPSATAGGTDGSTLPPTQTVEQTGSFVAQSTAIDVAATNVTVKGRTVLTVLGSTLKVHGKCVVTKVPLSRPPKGYTCMILPRGIKMVEDGYNVGNTTVRYNEVTRKGRQTFYWDGHGWRDAFCRNHVWFHQHVSPVSVLLVKNTAKLNLNVKVRVAVKVSGSVGVICRLGDNWATATGSGSASASAEAVITIRASSFAEVRSYVGAHKASIASSLTASVTAAAGANALVSGGASCHVSVVTPPPLPPAVVFVTPPEHVVVTVPVAGQPSQPQVRICAQVYNAPNPQVVFSAIYGTVSPAYQPTDLNIPDAWCTWYLAPEAPASETVTVAVTSNGQTAVATAAFPVVADRGF